MSLGRWLRCLAAAAMLFLVLAIAYESLRLAGFRFRWETDPVAATPEPTPPPRFEQARGVERDPPRRAAEGGSIDGGPGSPRDEPVVREPAGAEAPAPNPGPRFGWGRPIDFETFPGGSEVCAPCPVSDEFAARGVRFSFRSWSASSPLPFLVDAGEYLPGGEPSPLRVGPALADAGSMEVGVIRLELSGGPRRVTFEVVGPSLIERFEVSAWSGGRRIESTEIPRFDAQTYSAAGGGRFRSERVVVESGAGIDRIELDGWGPPGHLLLIDHLVMEDGRDRRP